MSPKVWLKPDSSYDDSFVTTDGQKGSFRYDNFRSHQWRENWHNEESRFSMICL